MRNFDIHFSQRWSFVPGYSVEAQLVPRHFPSGFPEIFHLEKRVPFNWLWPTLAKPSLPKPRLARQTLARPRKFWPNWPVHLLCPELGIPIPALPGPPSPGTATALRRTAQNFAFFPLPPQCSFFLPSLEGLLVEFWWCFKGRDPQLSAFGLSGCRVNGAPTRTPPLHLPSPSDLENKI